MPRRYTCPECGRITSQRHCSAHQPRPKQAHWSRHRDTVRQARFRKAVLERDHHQCVRCGSTQDLRACHHPKPLRDYSPGDPQAYHPDAGITLCATCDRASDPYAR